MKIKNKILKCISVLGVCFFSSGLAYSQTSDNGKTNKELDKSEVPNFTSPYTLQEIIEKNRFKLYDINKNGFLETMVVDYKTDGSPSTDYTEFYRVELNGNDLLLHSKPYALFYDKNKDKKPDIMKLNNTHTDFNKQQVFDYIEEFDPKEKDINYTDFNKADEILNKKGLLQVSHIDMNGNGFSDSLVLFYDTTGNKKPDRIEFYKYEFKNGELWCHSDKPYAVETYKNGNPDRTILDGIETEFDRRKIVEKVNQYDTMKKNIKIVDLE